MKITKLNENQELADLYKQIDSNMSQDLYDRAVKMSDEASTRIIRNNDKLLKQYNSDENIQKRKEQKELDDYNNRLDTEKEFDSYSMQEVEKMFNNPKFRSNKEYKKKAMSILARNYDTNLGMKTASKVLTSYKPEFIKSWADSFNWQSVADKNEPFVQALNNPDVAKLLNGDEVRWVKLYNMLYDSDAQGYADQPGTLIGNPNLYKLKNQNEAKQLVKIDIQDGGKHRQGFNKRLDTGNYGEILSLGKKIGVEDSSNKLINTIKNNSNNLSSEEKVTAAKALKLGKPELKKLSDDLDNANNN